MAIVRINVPEIIGTTDCVATADGQKVHDVIASNLREGNVVHVSFQGVKSIITAFLNAAIGQLYGEFKDEELSGKIVLIEAKKDDVAKVIKVVSGAKLYFKDKKKFDTAQQDALGTDGE